MFTNASPHLVLKLCVPYQTHDSKVVQTIGPLKYNGFPLLHLFALLHSILSCAPRFTPYH